MKQLWTKWLALRSKTQACKCATYVIAAVFAVTIFAQCVSFHSIVYGEASFEPIYLVSMLIKASIAIFFASFSLITPQKYWVLPVSALVGFWSMAELIYFRSNSIFIEKYSLTMVGNMAGVWDSIWLFNHAIDWVLLLPTLVLGIVVYLFYSKQTHFQAFLIALAVSFLLNGVGCYGIHRKLECVRPVCTHKHVFNPYAKFGEASYLGFTTENYVRNVSVLHSLIFQIKELVLMPFEKETYKMTTIESEQAHLYVQPPNVNCTPATPLIVLLIESFESWTITPEVTPNLYQFIQETPSLLYANKVQSQVRHGVSADGQMIVNTGLLPLTDGATCFRYPQHTYPAISHLYQNPGIVVALSLSYWNQRFMNDAYGIQQAYVVPSWLDSKMFDQLDAVKSQHDYILSLTMTMHAPFQKCPVNTYPSVDGMPDDIYRYLNSVKYMDKHLGRILSAIANDPQTHSSTVVITGDHNVLSYKTRNNFKQLNQELQLGFDEIGEYIPLIIYSPRIEQKVMITDTICQMDIYPTLLHILDCDSYYWKGFGVNLLEKDAWKHRPIQPKEAQRLSDKMIRANYFEKLVTEE